MARHLPFLPAKPHPSLSPPSEIPCSVQALHFPDQLLHPTHAYRPLAEEAGVASGYQDRIVPSLHPRLGASRLRHPASVGAISPLLQLELGELLKLAEVQVLRREDLASATGRRSFDEYSQGSVLC